MKRRSILNAALWTSLSAACFASLSFIPLQRPGCADPSFPFNADTLPAITEFETGRLDEALNYLDEQIRNTTGEMHTIDKARMLQQIEAAARQIDLDKIQSEARAVIKKIYFEKLSRDIDRAVASIDKAQLDKDIACAMTAIPKIDKEQLRNELRTALEGVQLDQLKGQLENAKKDLRLQQRNLGRELEQLRPGISPELRDTRRQLQQLKDAYQEMERDGLIEKGPNNRIQFRDGELYINGEKQTRGVSEKYRHYFKKRTKDTGIMVRV